jgi:ABC-type phosphate/phosphonate transport system permease subunit
VVIRSAVMVGMIRNGGLGLNRDEARQNEQG